MVRRKRIAAHIASKFQSWNLEKFFWKKERQFGLLDCLPFDCSLCCGQFIIIFSFCRCRTIHWQPLYDNCSSGRGAVVTFYSVIEEAESAISAIVFFSAGFEGDSTRSAVQHSKKSVQFHASFEAGEQSCNLAFSSAVLFLVQAVFDVFQLDSIWFDCRLRLNLFWWLLLEKHPFFFVCRNQDFIF